jgi:cyclic pyranopterin phosphate synthase
MHGAAMLIDRLQRPICDLRISVIDACNYRCGYCMPTESFPEQHRFLHKTQRLSFDEITRLTRIFADLGVRKVRITGGEPLLRRGLPQLVAELNAIPDIQDVALTTNGYWLRRDVAALKAAGLRRITVSLDSIDPLVYREMSGRDVNIERVLDGIAAADAAGLSPIKINVVVQKGVNDHTLAATAAHFRGSNVILRFIEFMDVGNRNNWAYEQVLTTAEIIQRIHAVTPIEPLGPNYQGEVATRYRYCDGSGELGFISSVSQPFCGDCHRARLSSDGKLFTCLFAAEGRDLRTPMREGASDADLRQLITEAWQARTDRYSELRRELAGQGHKVEMYEIGG